MKQILAIAFALLLFAPCASAGYSSALGHGAGLAKTLICLEQDAADGAESELTEISNSAKQTAVSIANFADSAVDATADKVIGILDWILNLIAGKRSSAEAEDSDEPVAVSAAVSKPIVKNSLIPALVLASIFATIAAIGVKLFFIPLRCKTPSNDQTLDNPARRRIFEMIKSRPGVRITEIANEAGIGWGAALYHISVLEKKGYITSNANAHRHSLFENNGKYTREERMAATVLRVGKSKEVLEYIKSNPGSSAREIASSLGISGSITSWYTKHLCEYGLIRKARNGKLMAHFVIESFAAGGASVH